MSADCIFCKIINKDIAAKIVFEDENYICFHDINPAAEVHVLIVPKKHIKSVDELEISDKELIGQLLLTAKKVAEILNISQIGYKLVCNVGSGGGQVVEHLHLHVLSGKNIRLP